MHALAGHHLVHVWHHGREHVRGQQLAQTLADELGRGDADPFLERAVRVRHDEVAIEIVDRRRHRVQRQLEEVARLAQLALGDHAIGDVLQRAVQTPDLAVATLRLDDHAHPQLAAARAGQAQVQVAAGAGVDRLLRGFDHLLAILGMEHVAARFQLDRLAERQVVDRVQRLGPVDLVRLDVVFPAADARGGLHVLQQVVEAHALADVVEHEHGADRRALLRDRHDAIFDRTELAILPPQQRADAAHDVGGVAHAAHRVGPVVVVGLRVDQDAVVEARQLLDLVAEQLGGGGIRVTNLADVVELEHAFARAFDDRLVAAMSCRVILARRTGLALAPTPQQQAERHGGKQQADDETCDPGAGEQSCQYRQGFCPGSRPAYQFTAYCMSCADVRSDSLRLMRWRCDSTVLTLRLSASAV